MIMAFAFYLGECSNNYAEIQAIKIGLKWCLDNGFRNLIIESDSLLTIHMINGNISTSWLLKYEIKKIQAMNAEGHIQFNHIFREGNSTADFLANLAEFKKYNSFFTTAINLPMQIISTLKNEKKRGPNFRIRVRKNTFIFDPG
ncbi:hypothetical protein MTR67_049055 [Solanum verrucosum]|uniref:RNase H type-1 domain-containing protein n=1 Tax=Solanum verrucosum TaxID=315347 RepID=A0AAF1A082_SOLVR|nr:hypothetical protein MTR67_049055 [Solanum verrucosum]